LYNKIIRKTIVFLDPELRSIRNIIRKNRDVPESIFSQRLEVLPFALKLSYWENHFEWKSTISFPEITGRILDFGCGSGHADIFLARNGRVVYGIDVNHVGIQIANFLKSRECEEVRKNLIFEVKDVTKDCCMDPCDSVWASHVFEHITDHEPIFNGLRNWVRKGAHILISVPLGDAYDNSDHVHHWNDEGEIENHFKKYLRIVKAEISYENKVLRVLGAF
jgi:2-polyprenyl-3-methyl-5-hydroxy-6-metoxy-1,4-benzoquinol methylase